VATGGVTIKQYEYDGDRLVRSTMRNRQNGDPPRFVNYDNTLVYDAEGLNHIVRDYDSYAGKSTAVIYRRPLKNAKARLDAIRLQLVAQLAAATAEHLRQFQAEHGTDDWYGFVLTPNVEGTYVACAFATERSLTAVADQFRVGRLRQ